MVKRPPNDITPSQFFETWLPEQYAELAKSVTTPPPDIAVDVDITGDGGGKWSLTLSGGELTVNAPPAGNASLAFVQSVEDWYAVTTGKAEEELGLELPEDSFASIDQLLVHPALGRLAGAIAGIKGTLDLELKNQDKRALGARLVFQNAAEPHATIGFTVETLQELQAGRLTPPEAFFACKIQIAGEAALAMQLGMLLMMPS